MVHENVIGQGTSVRGNVRSTGQGSGSAGSLTIRGQVEGDVKLEGDVVVDPGGRVGASIEAANVSVQGMVQGAVSAVRSISLGPGAEVLGDLRAPSIAIHPEARIRGRISMTVELPPTLTRGRPPASRW